MIGPCEHCGNKDKSKWLSQCLYKGSFPSRTAFIRSTFDPPCAGDAYDEGQQELRDRRRCTFVKWCVVTFLIGIALIAIPLVLSFSK